MTLEGEGLTLAWASEARTILELLHVAGLAHPSSCQEGDCGACTATLLRGRVVYLTSPNAMHDEQTCLPCCCRPVGPVTLER